MKDLALGILFGLFVTNFIANISSRQQVAQLTRELSDLRDLKAKDSIIQAQRCDSLIECKFGKQIK